jgi:dipeptidase E
MLLALLQLPHSTAGRHLEAWGLDPKLLAPHLDAALQPGTAPGDGTLPFTPAAKKVLQLSVEEAARLGHSYIGCEHVLLGLVIEGDCEASKLLVAAGARIDTLREAVAGIQARTGPVLRGDRSKLRLLLISNSTMHGGGYLEHCAAEIRDFLGARKRVLFVPYALHDHDAYADKAKRAFAAMGHDLASVHKFTDPLEPFKSADAVFVGGGNTFRLLNALYVHDLMIAIQQVAIAGLPYIGSSAGTNVATESIRTTNDMPIVEPPSFTALQLVPFQINPHYLDADPKSTHMGETREERLVQFLEEHDTPVLGMREGCMLRVEGPRMELRGTTKARLFRRGVAPEEFAPPRDLSFLLGQPSAKSGPTPAA